MFRSDQKGTEERSRLTGGALSGTTIPVPLADERVAVSGALPRVAGASVGLVGARPMGETRARGSTRSESRFGRGTGGMSLSETDGEA